MKRPPRTAHRAQQIASCPLTLEMPQFHVRNNVKAAMKLITSFRWHSSMSADATYRIRGQSGSRPVSVGPAGSPRTRGTERSRPRQRPTHWCPVETADRGAALVVAKVGDGVIRDLEDSRLGERAAPLVAIMKRLSSRSGWAVRRSIPQEPV
jgi:hypothetical protein